MNLLHTYHFSPRARGEDHLMLAADIGSVMFYNNGRIASSMRAQIPFSQNSMRKNTARRWSRAPRASRRFIRQIDRLLPF